MQLAADVDAGGAGHFSPGACQSSGNARFPHRHRSDALAFLGRDAVDCRRDLPVAVSGIGRYYFGRVGDNADMRSVLILVAVAVAMVPAVAAASTTIASGVSRPALRVDSNGGCASPIAIEGHRH